MRLLTGKFNFANCGRKNTAKTEKKIEMVPDPYIRPEKPEKHKNVNILHAITTTPLTTARTKNQKAIPSTPLRTQLSVGNPHQIDISNRELLSHPSVLKLRHQSSHLSRRQLHLPGLHYQSGGRLQRNLVPIHPQRPRVLQGLHRMAEEAKNPDKKTREAPRSSWVATIHGGVGEDSKIYDLAAIVLNAEAWPDIRYMLVGFETCPETRRDHLQCYFQLKRKQRFNQVKQIFVEHGLDAAHIEPAHGTPEENKKYCTKTGFWEEYGKCLRMGQRCDLELLAEDICDNMYPTIRDMALQNPVHYIRLHNGMSKLWSLSAARDHRDPPLIYEFSGPTGTGKTTGCRWFLKHILKVNKLDIYEYADDPGPPWWPGYHGQTTVIFEDFKGNYPLNSLLRILDTSIVCVPVKNDNVPLRAELFCFTSQTPLRDFYAMDLQHDAWVRRLDDFSVHMPPRKYKTTDEEYVNIEVNKQALLTCKQQYMKH